MIYYCKNNLQKNRVSVRIKQVKKINDLNEISTSIIMHAGQLKPNFDLILNIEFESIPVDCRLAIVETLFKMKEIGMRKAVSIIPNNIMAKRNYFSVGCFNKLDFFETSTIQKAERYLDELNKT